MGLLLAQNVQEFIQWGQMLDHLTQGWTRQQMAAQQRQTLARVRNQRPVEIEHTLQGTHVIAGQFALLGSNGLLELIQPPLLMYDFYNSPWHNQHAVIDSIGIIAAHKIGLFSPKEQTKHEQMVQRLLKRPVGMRRGIERGSNRRLPGHQHRGRAHRTAFFRRVSRSEERSGRAKVESQVATIGTPATSYKLTQHTDLSVAHRAHNATAGAPPSKRRPPLA